MKSKIVSSLVIAMLAGISSPVLASNTYFQIGATNLDIEKGGSWDANINAMTATAGYRLSDNLSLELGASFPFKEANLANKVDTYSKFIVGDSEENPSRYENQPNKEYQDTLKANYIANLNLKFDIPLHKNFDLFMDLGYAYGSFKEVINYNQTDFGFKDHKPTNNLGIGSACEKTGDENLCGTPVKQRSTEYNGGGFSYGGGIRFIYDNDTSINLQYKNMLLAHDINVSSLSLNFQMFF